MDASPLIVALSNQLGLRGNPTLSQVTDHPKLRSAIDAEVSVDLLAAVAETLEEIPETVYRRVINLSLSSWLLPPDAIDVLEDCTLTELDGSLDQPGLPWPLQRASANGAAVPRLL